MKLNAPQIKAFARQFDPQPFHLDEKIAKDTLFGAWPRAVGIPPP
jgi:acyl dehydratase